MTKVRTLVFSESIPYLEKAFKFLTNEDEFEIIGVYTESKKMLGDLKSITPQLILIINEVESDNKQFNKIINYVNNTTNLPKVMSVNFTEDDKFIISEVLSYRDNLNIISKTIRDIYENKCRTDIISKDYKKLVEKVNFNELLDEFELTDTEKKILYLKKIGLTRNEIAEKRFVSNETVRNQITNILKKIGVNTTKEALCKIKAMAQINSNSEIC